MFIHILILFFCCNWHRLFWKTGSVQVASQGTFVQNWQSNNISVSSATGNRDVHSLTEYLMQGLNIHADNSEPEIFGSGFQNVLNKLTASGLPQSSILVKKIITPLSNDSSQKFQEKQKSHGSEDSPSNYLLVAVYIPLLREGVETEDKTTGTVFQPAVLELHMYISSTSPFAFVSTTGASVGADDYHLVPDDILRSDFVGQLLLVRDTLLSEYKSILISQKLKYTLSSEQYKSQSTLSCLNIIKSCLSELHAEGASIVSILKPIEVLLLTLPAVKSLRLKVCVAPTGANLKQASDVEDIRSPASAIQSSVKLKQKSREINSVGRPSNQLQIQTFPSIDSFGGSFSPGPQSANKITTTLYESQQSSTADRSSAESSESLCEQLFDFQCYEVFGQLQLALSHQAEAYDLTEILGSFSKALGRRCYELYRGQRSKKQLVHEQKLNFQLTGQVSSLKYVINLLCQLMHLHMI